MCDPHNALDWPNAPAEIETPWPAGPKNDVDRPRPGVTYESWPLCVCLTDESPQCQPGARSSHERTRGHRGGLHPRLKKQDDGLIWQNHLTNHLCEGENHAHGPTVTLYWPDTPTEIETSRPR